MNQSPYPLGEVERETHRLAMQNLHLRIDVRARWAGLQPGMKVVDAGCGPGETSRSLARLVGPAGRVDAFDLSDERLRSARARDLPPDAAPLTFRNGSVLAPPYESGAYDFVFCQFVLEYVPDRVEAISALAGLLKPGGILCLCEPDPIGGLNYPEPPDVTRGREALLRVVASAGFDAQLGRKLHSLLASAGLRGVDTLVEPLAFGGTAPDWEIENWKDRFEGLAGAGVAALGSPEAYALFVAQYLEMLANPSILKLTNLITSRALR